MSAELPLVLVVDDQPWFLAVADWQATITDVRFEVEVDPMRVVTRDMTGVLCVFLDHRMPRLVGAQVAQTLRERGYVGMIYAIGVFAAPGYPGDCIWTGKMLSVRKVRAMIACAQGALSREALQAELHR